MKQINNFINEKLKLTKDLVKQQNEKLTEFKMYDFDDPDKYLYSVKVDLNKPYVVYRDAYHYNNPHIATVYDMLWLIGSWASDFEGFSTKDILFQTDDIDELRDYVKQKYNKSTWYDNEKYVDDLINGKETVESWAEFKNSKELQDLLDDYR